MEAREGGKGISVGKKSKPEAIYSIVFECKGKEANFQLFNTRGNRERKDVVADIAAAMLLLEKMQW